MDGTYRKITRNNLTLSESLSLANHLIACGHSVIAESQHAELAHEAEQRLGFRVTPCNVRHVLVSIGVTP